MGAQAAKIAEVLRYKVGRPMTLRRLTLAPGSKSIPLDVTVYGTTDGATISKLLGIVVETNSHAVFSNAEIFGAQWPSPPAAEDRIVIDGKPWKIAAVETKYLGSEILVFICQIVGM